MYQYSSNDVPPAPVVPVEVSTVYDSNSVCNIDALIDSGADISCIPLLIINALNLIPFKEGSIIGITGQVETVGVYAVNIVFHGISFENHSVYGTSIENYLILGRDILNKLHICLDGIEGIVRVI